MCVCDRFGSRFARCLNAWELWMVSSGERVSGRGYRWGVVLFSGCIFCGVLFVCFVFLHVLSQGFVCVSFVCFVFCLHVLFRLCVSVKVISCINMFVCFVCSPPTISICAPRSHPPQTHNINMHVPLSPHNTLICTPRFPPSHPLFTRPISPKKLVCESRYLSPKRY